MYTMPDPLLIYLPKDTVNDESYKVIEVRIASGELVKMGQTFAVFETSKTSVEVSSSAAGRLYHQLKVGDQVYVGTLIAAISNDPTFSFSLVMHNVLHSKHVTIQQTHATDANQATIDNRISHKAMVMIKEYNLDLALFEHLKIIRTRDVEEHLQRHKGTPITKKDVLYNNLSNNILILGGGGHAKMCIDIIRHIHCYEIIGIIDESLPLGSNVMGIPVVGRDADLHKFRDQGVRLAVNGIGAVTRHGMRTKFFYLLKDAGFELPNLIHPSAIVEPTVHMGEGNQIMSGCIIGSDTHIGCNCIVNSGAVVSHDCLLADHVHVAPGAILAGKVRVGQGSVVGMGVTVFFDVEIGENTTINNGIDIFRNVPAGIVVKERL